MSNFYIRHNIGSDAADGSAATPWATITGGATAARIAPGDTIYIGKSPDPLRVASIGGTDVDGTWTKNNNTLTFSHVSWKEIQTCNSISGWVASANITVGTNANRREGTNSISITPASAFTTGLAAYVPVSSLDLTGCTGISFWAGGTTGTIATNTWRIDLCSDAVGSVPVYSFTINRSISTNPLQRFYLDTGGSMTTAINSIAFVALSDPGTNGLLVDNIVGCTSKCNLLTLFGKDSTAAIGTGLDDCWFSIESFGSDGVNAKLIALNSETAPTTRTAFIGTSETVALYSREMTVVSASETVQDAGTSSSAITFQGGYDFTASAVNGETIFYFPTTSGVTVGQSWIVMSNLSVVGSSAAPFTISGHAHTISIPIAAQSGNTSAIATTNGNRNAITVSHIWGATNITAINSNSGSLFCYNASAMSSSCSSINGGQDWRIHVRNASPGTNVPIFLAGSTGLFNRFSFENALSNYGRILQCNGGDIDFSVLDIYQISGGTTDVPGLALATGSNYTKAVLRNINAPSSGTIASFANYSHIVFERYDQTADNHRIYGHLSALEWETSTTQTHGTTGISWKGTPQSSRDINTTAIFNLGSEHLIGGEAIAFSVWVYLTNANSNVKFCIRGGQIEGIDNDVSISANTGTLNAWQQLTLPSVTPTVTGTLVLAIEAYGSNQPFYFGDLSYT